MTITKSNTEIEDEEEKQVCSVAINECSDEHTEKDSPYYSACQKYLENQICGISAFKETDCRLTITDLKCGSLITEHKLVLGVRGSDPSGILIGSAGKVIRDEIKDGSLGALAIDTTSFNSTFKGNVREPKSTKKPPQVEFNVYVIVTMEYTWYEFCKIKEHFRETIASRSYDMKGKKLKTTDIFIVNSETNCAMPADKTKEGIDVWLVALGSDADKVTIQIGNDLKDLLDSRQLTKLGNLFEDR
ncbi:Hypothetical predicted protein, partial [Paramuricea clavata]